MIIRKESAKFAKAKFYTSFNDIDVFVEDTALESRKVYLEILRRVLGSNILISQIFPLGSKPTVVKRCRADQAPRERRVLYIVDGDYDCAEISEQIPRLYRLKRYCIENYLVDHAAIIDVINDDSIDEDEATISRKLDFREWIERLGRSLSLIVLAQIASTKKQCALPTVRLDLGRIEGDFHDQIDLAKSLELVNEYRSVLDERWGVGTFDELIVGLRRSIKVGGEAIFLRHMSAKAVLMPLLRNRLKRRVGVEVDYPRFRVRLARRCDVSELADIAAVLA